MVAGGELARNTVAVVLAGGKGTRLGSLTRQVCKPALPFGAGYRNIDFSLSNCVNSEIRRIGVATQYKPDSLLRHIGQIWSAAATGPGEFISAWPSEVRAPAAGYRGTADAVFRNLDLIEGLESDLVLVLAGDHVYRMDYRPMLELHRARRANVTVGCIEVHAQEASQFGIVSVDSEGRIDRFVEKPKTLDELPGDDRVLASMGIYVFDRPFVADVLRRDAFSSQSKHDFGGDILPSLLRDAKVYAYPFLAQQGGEPAYWRDVGTPEAYWLAHLELLDDSPSLRLDDSRWPLPTTLGKPRLTARHACPGTGRRRASKSLIAEGCEVAGTVNRSVLFAGVRIASGAVVEDSVVLPGAVIGRNCRLSSAIVDSDCRVPDGTIMSPARRTDDAGHARRPVVITDEDQGSDLLYSCA